MPFATCLIFCSWRVYRVVLWKLFASWTDFAVALLTSGFEFQFQIQEIGWNLPAAEFLGLEIWVRPLQLKEELEGSVATTRIQRNSKTFDVVRTLWRRVLKIFVLRPVSYSYSVWSRLGHVHRVTIHPA
jgi:hypothetical protein